MHCGASRFVKWSLSRISEEAAESLMKALSFIVFSLALSAAPAAAEWTLDNDSSRISFVSTKAGSAAEVHGFEAVDGRVDRGGRVTITVDLDSVNTAVPIRDERMRTLLFETDENPTATVAASVDMDAVDALAPGQETTMVAEGQLMLRGMVVSLTIDMSVARLSDTRVLVASRKPLIVNAGQLDLLEGVEKLREVVGLPSISPAVPVSFVLAFSRPPG